MRLIRIKYKTIRTNKPPIIKISGIVPAVKEKLPVPNLIRHVAATIILAIRIATVSILSSILFPKNGIFIPISLIIVYGDLRIFKKNVRRKLPSVVTSKSCFFSVYLMVSPL